MLGTPVDLSKIDLDSYVVAGIDDHISPWPSAYRATQMLGGNKRFVLSNSGHIAAMVNPPTNPKATFRVGTSPRPTTRNGWPQAETVQGSWWPDYTAWLESRSGDMKDAPKTAGRREVPAAGPRARDVRPGAVAARMRPGTGEGPVPGRRRAGSADFGR